MPLTPSGGCAGQGRSGGEHGMGRGTGEGKGRGKEGARGRPCPSASGRKRGASGSLRKPGPGAWPVARVPPRVTSARPCPRPCAYNPGCALQLTLLRHLPAPPRPR